MLRLALSHLRMKLLNFLNKTIEFSFYLLFFLVPLTLVGDTSELFEFNKLWVTFILTIIIGVSWTSKMIVNRRFQVQKTPLDIPIALFVGSQILSTIFSLDTHVSLWGYYSRFNGGLLSIFAFVFLYYAFVSNFKDLENQEQKENLVRYKLIGLFIAGILVFFIGSLIASFFKATAAGQMFPLQMLVSLTTVLASLAIFLKAFPSQFLKRILYFAITGAVLVVAWGLPSHFGYDPTCLLFRGTLDVSCWTAEFQPKIRLFSTLGQPAWYGAYLAVVIPLVMAFFINFVKEGFSIEKGKKFLGNTNLVLAASAFIFIGLSYISLLWTGARGSVIAAWFVFAAFLLYYFWFYIRPKFNLKKPSLDFKVFVSLVVLLYGITFFNGQPFSFLDIFTFKGMSERVQKITSQKPAENTTPQAPEASPAPLGGTESGEIRLYVWKGGLDIWKNYPIFGSGVETYAFAYYKVKPIGHNLTSEWNFLYNKAHNEYVNYLATTGTVGIATYLLLIASFLFLSVKFLIRNTKKLGRNGLLLAAVVASYISILITNFFGFSVVMINVFFYLLPALFFIRAGMLKEKGQYSFAFSNTKAVALSNIQKIAIAVIILVALYLIFVLARFWQADRYYYLGYNFDRGGNYQEAYPFLQKAVELRPSEPTFKDELSLNNAILASAILYQTAQNQNENEANIARELLQNAVTTSDLLQKEHPNNIVFAKTRVRVFYTLAQIDQSYLPKALEAIKRAKELAPTDADISYNLGVLLGQNGMVEEGIKELQETVKLKPDYQGGNAHYALALFYHQLAINENGQVVNPEFENKAIETMEYILKEFGQHQGAQEALNTWKK
jgi:putative inorganic carbon (hco3(-)) transporter